MIQASQPDSILTQLVTKLVPALVLLVVGRLWGESRAARMEAARADFILSVWRVRHFYWGD